jgi:hypothetical protein
VQVDHEEILCNYRIRIPAELWPSFPKFVEQVMSSSALEVCWEDAN